MEKIQSTDSKDLMFEHARLVAAHAAGNESVIPRLQEIEDLLQMDAAQIAAAVVEIYMKDY